MTNEEAEELLKKLTKHYGEPVMPINRYCNSLKVWANCIIKANIYDPNGWNHGSEYYKVLDKILLDISKSNLLWRLLYVGETFRSEKCPQCNGIWNGSVMTGMSKCRYGCEGTGWLHEDWQLRNLLK